MRTVNLTMWSINKLTFGGFKSASIDIYRHVIKCSKCARHKFLALYYCDSRVRLLSLLCWLRSLSLQENVRLGQARVRLAQERIEWRERAFFIETKREKQRKLLEHYHRLRKVFHTWLEARSNTTNRLAGYNVALAPFYLNDQKLLEPQEPDRLLYQLAMEHVRSGYPELQALFEQLKALEDRNNQQASSLVEKIDVRDMLKTFPDLSPLQSEGNQTDYYWFEGILEAVQKSDLPLSLLVADPYRLLTLNSVETIARGNSSTIAGLKAKIEDLRTLHQNDYKRVKVNHEQDEKLVKEIHGKVSDIVSEIEELESLKGECDYERLLQ
jgi:hypothetical protein